MNKGRFVFGILVVFLLISISFAFAETESEKVNDAYTCLRNKINEKKCSELSIEEQVFSLLAVSKCKSEVVSILKKDAKTTAQAILALDRVGFDTGKVEDWLQSQTQPPSELTWYLQIESSEPTTCKISYSTEHTIEIDENKKINARAGSCLTLAQGGYWLEISPSCFDEKFSISCDKQFFTNLLYKKKDSSTIYLSEIHSASADGTTEEKVNSLCFKKDDSCDYESTLWAALALNKKGYNINYYLPYLVSMMDENKKYLPEAFLYLLTENEDYYDNLLLKQTPTDHYWEESDNKYYDTALALYALQNDDSPQKSDAIKWLLDVQNEDGCWRGVTETAFILYSVWPEEVSVPEPSDEDLESCDELNGELCSYGEECDGKTVDSSDGRCCLGTCKEKPIPDDSESDSDKDSEKDEKKSYWYIWVLVFLIILTIIGIIFRDRIRPYWFRLKHGFGRGGGAPSSSQGPAPPGFLPPATPGPRIRPRRILPSGRQPTQSRRPIMPKPKSPKEKEFSDILKKLKEIGS